jgi:hypothetical protein
MREDKKYTDPEHHWIIGYFIVGCGVAQCAAHLLTAD